jgi:hypothetical protein
VPIDKLTPIIDENFPHSHPFRIVDRRAVEVSNVTAIKEWIRNHGFCPLRENQLSSTEMTPRDMNYFAPPDNFAVSFCAEGHS